ncbi:cytochrome P450 [Mycobacterium sp. URHB0044]|uniref:cytochrome P450 n=1 Tax=Mycobacterium sp. URHB0044 TaxID=1380386 RepID=UPI00048F5703|nr:cytochrome P450 [Mycobacterium sp. URHB0044]
MPDANVPRLTGAAALTALTDLGLASIAAGAIARRRPVIRLLERTQADARGVSRLRALHKEFGSGPVELAIPGRRILVILDPDDVGRVLAESPNPFDPANREKRQALQQFQPHGVLISTGHMRDRRRAVNEAALDTPLALHRLAEPFTRAIEAEAGELAAEALQRGSLDSSAFMTAWWRLVRRLVLGDAARDDGAITDDLWRLRSAGNWAFLGLPHTRMRERFFDRLYGYAEAADPNSLVGALAQVPAEGAVDPVGQIPQWLFAFDAAGMAALRAAAVLATHPAALQQCETGDLGQVAVRPFLRACVLESVRLWPTTPTLLRDTSTETTWRDGAFTVDAGAAVMIIVPAFHRDPDLPFADEFVPDIWLDGRAQQYPQLVPFSAGPVECPGRNLVLFATSTLLANLLGTTSLELRSTPRLEPSKPLPATLNQLTLEFGVAPVSARVP